jgi:ATP-binding cassette subfamily C protein CydC
MTKAAEPLSILITAERSRQWRPLLLASVGGVAVASASAALLGVSGWFITGAAAAGIGGTALAFNYMLPSAGIRLCAVLRTAGRYGERLTGHQAALRGLARIRPALFAGLAASPVSEALALSTGEASARLVQDVDAIETLFVRISGRWSAVAAVICGVLLTGLASVPAAGVLAALFVLQVAAGRALALRLSRQPAQRLHQASGRMKDAYASLVAASPELVCYGLQDWAVERIGDESRAVLDARRAVADAQGWQSAVAASLTAVAAITVLLLAHRAPLPLVALATLAAAVTMEGAGGLIRAFEQDGAVAEAGLRLNPLLAHAGKVEQRAYDLTPPALSIRSEAGDINLLPGEGLAIVGPSGCGKTTLIEQFLRLRATAPGRLDINGLDVADLDDDAARRCFSYAPQGPTLLAATIRENLLLAAPAATDDALWGALFDARLDGKVMRLPARLDAWIGEDGERLSGGERRRLALARAYLRPAPWLVLDEPTEGLDQQTEQDVLDHLRSRLVRTKQGLLIVSHRPAVLQLDVRVLHMDETIVPSTQNAEGRRTRRAGASLGAA